MKYEMQKTYPTSQLEESNMSATMFLFGDIGFGEIDDDGNRNIDGNAFASEMRMLKDMGFDITVDINSGGGSIMAGLPIFDAVRVTKADTRIVGVAASMAGAVSQAGIRRFMNDIGSLMIHGIQANGADEQFIEILRAQLKGILADRSKLTEQRIDEIMGEDNNEWFAVVGVPDNRHALKMGLVDEVIDTGFKMEKDLLVNPDNGSKLAAVYNKILAPVEPDKPKTMSEFLEVKKALDLDPEASEAAVAKAVNKIKAEADSVATVKATNKTLEIENASLKEVRVNELVGEGKEAGYPEDKLESLRTFANSDYDGAKALVDSLKETKNVNGEGAAGAGAGSASTVSGQVDTNAENNGGKKPEASAEGGEKTYDEYMKTAKGEAEFYALETDAQNKILDAHALEHNITKV